jgi:werner syndrome ATP-dependent helicase
MEFEEPSVDHEQVMKILEIAGELWCNNKFSFGILKQFFLKVLEQYFRHSKFKKEQWAIIRGIMYEKRDCCIIASTGFGKSLIYQFPPVFMKKLTVVISPLISLMEDQVLSLKAKGIKACFFGSMQMDKSLEMIDHNIVYITPEYLKYNKHKLRAVRDKIIMFAIDEAHLIDQWSDFRKEYGKLGSLRESFPEIPIVALTATAPQYVKGVIITSLQLKNEIFVRTFLDRPNLEFTVLRKGNGFMIDVFPLLRNLKEGSAIVYCISRDLTDKIAEAFNNAGIVCEPYHSEHKAEHRKMVVRDFRNNKLRFVICTIAYGMGIDKGDVRLVVHYGVSKSLEAYYQEAGRAGRDGKQARCVLFHENNDYVVLRNFIGKSKIPEEIKKNKYLHELIDKVANFVASTKCRRLDMLNYLGTTDEELKKITIRSDCCDNCKKDLLYNIPPQLQYHGVDDNGAHNFTHDSRILLRAINRHLLRVEIINLLLGELPTKEIFSWFRLEVFGLGRGKSKDWWNYLISLLVQNQFLHVAGNTLHLDKKAKKFLRFKGSEMLMKPSQQLLNFFEKKNDIELYWNNGEVASRSKFVQLSQADSAAELTAQPTNRVLLPSTLYCYGDSDEDLDEAMMNQINKLENENKADRSLRDQRDKEEIESLAGISFDEDQGESSGLGESSRKRNRDESDDEWDYQSISKFLKRKPIPKL